ncbi:MAG: mannonate dehydratase [bacterium]
MALEQTWRWFGPKDPISLKEIKQTGATGIVTALHHIPAGAAWPVEEIMSRKQTIAAEGLTWPVAESVPVHEEIKKRNGNYRRYLDNFKNTLRHLGQCGIDTVCYNFMPVLDWSRTDLEVVFHDGSITTKFESRAFAAFDVFILQRATAEKDYSAAQLHEARRYFERLNDDQRRRLVQAIMLGFPGSGETYTFEELRAAVHEYEAIGTNELRESLCTFLREITPVAEESGVALALHPDDPPWPLLGLPRVVSDKKDIEKILQTVDARANGLTFCTGSLGASSQNDLVHMAESFAGRIHFIHLRNVARKAEGDFLEDNHLEGDVDMYGVLKALLIEQKRRRAEGRKDARMPMRPDHGHLMLADQHRQGIYPGYSLVGRMRGLAELRGLELGIQRALQL